MTWNVTRPQPVASIVDKVQRQLNQGEQVVSVWTILAVTLAIASVLTTLLFLVYFYLRFRAAAAVNVAAVASEAVTANPE